MNRIVPMAVGAALVLAAIGLRAADYKRAPGPHQVEVLRLDWRDASRQRTVPVKIYHPASAPGASPVILFSHGLGGTREAYEYLGRHWASHGYVSVHLQHAGSDDAVWRGSTRPMESMRGAVKDWKSALHRPLDARFALDELTKLNQANGPLKGRLDLARVGMSGHSFGGWTTLAVSGMSLGPGGAASLADPRIKAAIAMSAPANRLNADQVYAGIKIPIYHLTGTADNSPLNETKPEDRRIPFDHIQNAEEYLLTFNGGDHMVFSGRSGLRGNRAKDPVFHDLIRMSTTAFWDAYLKGDAAAKTWLAGGGFEQALGREGTFEQRRK